MQAPGCRGAALPIVDVTIPGRASFLDGIAVCFSLMPLFLGILMVAGMIWTRKLSLLCAVFFWVALLVVCEVLKGIVPGDRPFGSCAVSSGHGPTVVITAYAFLSWLTLEMVVQQPQLLRLYKLGYVIAACMLLGPIPAARSRLRDHYALQLGIGIVIGLLAGVVWFLLMKFVIGGRVLRWIGVVKARVKCLQFINIKNDYFATREDYEEQVRLYEAEGVLEKSKRKSEAALDGMEPPAEGGVGEDGAELSDGAASQHRRNQEDIFGGSLSDDDEDASAASVVSNLDDMFSPRGADGAEKAAKKNTKNDKKGGGAAGAESSSAFPLVPFASPYGADFSSSLQQQQSASSPRGAPPAPTAAGANNGNVANNNNNNNTNNTAGADGPVTASGVNSATGGNTSGTPEDNTAAGNSNTTGRGGGRGQQQQQQQQQPKLSPISPHSPTRSALKGASPCGPASPITPRANGGNGSDGIDTNEASMRRRRGGDASDSNEASGRPGVRTGFVAFAD